MGDFTGHQELKRVLGAGVVAEVDQSLIDYFRPCFRGDVARKIHVQ
jgi:hypothetical protein